MTERGTCTACNHPDRAHRVPSGMGGARWPLKTLNCSMCPDGTCNLPEPHEPVTSDSTESGKSS